MANLDLVEVFIRPLHEAGVPYMVSGSLASMHYGEPRLTLDVDLVVHLDEENVGRFLTLFPEREFYRPPVDVVSVELRRPSRGHFNLIHFDTGFKADCYPSKNHPFWAWAWANRRLENFGEEPVYVAPPEYVIMWKMEFFREGGGDKHLRDIRGMMAVSGDSIDKEILNDASEKLGLTNTWKIVQSA